MSNTSLAINADTRIGALKTEAYRSIVLASIGGGLVFTWLGHLMAWTPAGFAVHGCAGVMGGYFVGTAIARAALGIRTKRGSLLQLPLRQRVTSSSMRLVVGALCFYGSYLWAVGVTAPTVGLQTFLYLLPAVVVFAMVTSFIRHLKD